MKSFNTSISFSQKLDFKQKLNTFDEIASNAKSPTDSEDSQSG